MSELAQAIDRYLASLRIENASPHTLRNYESDLRQFLDYFSPPETEPLSPAALTTIELREWLGSLYDQKLKVTSIRRKLAAIRSLFHFMSREKTIPTNVARLLRTPKAPKRLPAVPTEEQTNNLIDRVAAGKMDRPFLERDVLLFELL